MTESAIGRVIILSGPPGAGKSTVARLVAQRFPLAVHLHTDDFWHAIVAGALPPYLPESDHQNQIIVGVTAEAAFGYAAGGYTTIVDGIVGPWMLPHHLRTAAEHPEIPMHYLVLRPDRETTLHRAQGRSASGALVAAEPIVSLWEQFADLGAYESHAIDTSRLDPEHTAIVVVDAVAAGTQRIHGTLTNPSRYRDTSTDGTPPRGSSRVGTEGRT